MPMRLAPEGRWNAAPWKDFLVILRRTTFTGTTPLGFSKSSAGWIMCTVTDGYFMSGQNPRYSSDPIPGT